MIVEPPNLSAALISDCLLETYQVRAVEVHFLPLGADANTVVYRASSDDGQSYFVKLRRGEFDGFAARLAKLMRGEGIRQIVAPIAAENGALWTALGAYHLILYPFITGQNAYEHPLSESEWREFGAALWAVHTLELPDDLLQSIPRETYSPAWRNRMRELMAEITRHRSDDDLSRKLVEFLEVHRGEIMELINRAEFHARAASAQALPFVLCHSDIHAFNLMIAEDGALYLVDWDEPILAPKERDLMFIAGAQGFRGCTPEEETERFTADTARWKSM
ncbi:MAG: aminoglycoside phosphotransferase family protein [Anaerolineaceae bacterium]|nr:aminoglycoside phosphotransferase family protein [Anaerolineaceae bacterium]